MILNETISATLTGSSVTGLAISLTPAYSLKNAMVDDYVHNTFTVNPGTSAVVIDIGKILTAKHILAVSNGPLSIILTQNSTNRTVDFNGAFLIDGDFTAVKISNSGSEARELTVLISGNRALVGTGPGVYSVR